MTGSFTFREQHGRTNPACGKVQYGASTLSSASTGMDTWKVATTWFELEKPRVHGSRMRESWNPIDVTSDHVIGFVGSVVIVAWLNKTTLKAFAPCGVALQRAKKVGAGSTGLLSLIAPAAPPPGDAERRGIASMLADPQNGIVASAVVYEGEGLRAAAVRGVITGVQLLARPPFQHKAFGAIHDAAAWLATYRQLEITDLQGLTNTASDLLHR